MNSKSFGWGSIDVRYPRSEMPQLSKKSPLLRAWRGERVSAQAVLATPVDLDEVTFEVSDLRCGKNVIHVADRTLPEPSELNSSLT